MIDILINHYQEPPEIIGRLLRSIERQTGIDLLSDVHVYIGNDGTDCTLSEDFIKGFSIPISYFILPHRGVCATRNYLLDQSNSDYVMFCDADDLFHTENGLSVLLSAARKNDPDVITSAYTAEIMRDGSITSIAVTRDMRHVHGMIFKRSYLFEKTIRFPDEMETCGDMYFLWLAFRLTKKIVWLSDNFYTWKWNPSSVTRMLPFYRARNYQKIVKCYTLLTENVIQRERKDLYNNLIASFIQTLYVDSVSSIWDEAPEEFVQAGRDAAACYVRTYRGIYNALPEQYRKERYGMTLFSKRTRGPAEGFSGIERWMNHLISDRME